MKVKLKSITLTSDTEYGNVVECRFTSSDKSDKSWDKSFAIPYKESLTPDVLQQLVNSINNAMVSTVVSVIKDGKPTKEKTPNHPDYNPLDTQ